MLTKKPKEWDDSDLVKFAQMLRKNTKPMLIAANKADLCEDLGMTDEIHKNRDIVNCSAETELVLKKAAKANMIDYIPGNEKFVANKNMNMSNTTDRFASGLYIQTKRLQKDNVTMIITLVCFSNLRTITNDIFL